MTAELGHSALIVALCLAVIQAIVPMVGSFAGYRSWMRLGHSLALGQFVILAHVICLPGQRLSAR